MLISFESTFIESTEKLKDDFSEQSKIELAQRIEANYSKIRSVILEQEKSKDSSKPKELDIGDIGTRSFAFSIYFNDDLDDIPIRIREIIPTISPVRLDLMSTLKTLGTEPDTNQLSPTNQTSNYLRVARVYDDGSIKAKYLSEVLREDEGARLAEGL